MDVLEAISKNNLNLLKVKLSRKKFDINATIYDESEKKKKKVAVATPLVYACEKQLTETFKLLIKEGADVNKETKDEKKRTPLYMAAFLGNLELTKILVSENADVNRIPDSGLSALHGAVEKDHHEIVKYLIEQKADVNIKDDKTTIGTPLYHASNFAKKPDCTKLLAENGAKVDLNQGHLSTTPFLNSILNGKSMIMEALLDGGADINALHNGKSAVWLAVENEKEKCLKSLIERNLPVNIKFEGLTPFRYWLIKRGMRMDCKNILPIIDKHTKEELEEFGPTGDKKNPAKITHLMLAAKNASDVVVNEILKKGVDVKKKNANGDTALHYVYYSDYLVPTPKKVEVLLKAGADPMEKNEAEITPFYYLLKGRWCTGYRCTEHVQLMINYSKTFDVNQRDFNGDTPLLLAAGSSSPNNELLEVLLKNGADINAVNRDGQTALHFVCLKAKYFMLIEYDKKSPVKFLLGKGAKIQMNGDAAYPFYLLHYENDYKVFLKHGTDLNKQNKNGDTLLHYLIKSSPPKVYWTVTHLLDSTKKLDFTLKNNDDKTVYDLIPECHDSYSRSSFKKMFDEYIENKRKLEEKRNSQNKSSLAAKTNGGSKTVPKPSRNSSTCKTGNPTPPNAIKSSKPVPSTIAVVKQRSVKSITLTPTSRKSTSSKSPSLKSTKKEASKEPTVSAKTIKVVVKTTTISKNAKTETVTTTETNKGMKEGISKNNNSDAIASNDKSEGNKNKAPLEEEINNTFPNTQSKSKKNESNNSEGSDHEIRNTLSKSERETGQQNKTKTSDNEAKKITSTADSARNNNDDNAAMKYHKDVMISYQWDSQEIAVRLRDDLVKKGKLNVWIDLTDMSDDMNEAMAKGVAYSSIFVMCMSQKYSESINCKKEYSYADRLRKHIIPVKVQSDFSPMLGTALDLIVGANIYYDLGNDYNNQVKKLIADIKKHLQLK